MKPRGCCNTTGKQNVIIKTMSFEKDLLPVVLTCAIARSLWCPKLSPRQQRGSARPPQKLNKWRHARPPPANQNQSRRWTRERASAAPLPRQMYAPTAQAHATTTRPRRVSAASPTTTSLMLNAESEAAQRVKREPKRYDMHGRYHRLGDARWCADGVLEVAEVGAR